MRGICFSIENLVSGSELDTINRSQVVKNLCPGRDSGDMGRDIGITMTGKISRLECTLGLFNGSGINTKDDNRHKDLALRFVLRPLGALSVGLSHYMGRSHPQSENPVIEKNRTGVDLSLIHEPITLKGEFIYARDDRVDRYGWYIQTGYFLLRHKLQVIVKYDFFDRDMALTGDRIQVATLGLNYHFLKKTKFQINCEYRRDESCQDPDLVFLAQLQAGF